MKIGYFTALFPYDKSFKEPGFNRHYHLGGGEIWAYHLAQQMSKMGHDIAVFTTSVDSKNHVEKDNKITIYRYGTNFKIEKAHFSIDLLFQPLHQDVDIVHLHFTLPPGNLSGLFYATLKKKPLVVTYHGDAMPEYGSLIRRVGLGIQDQFLVPAILSKANCITTYSDYYISVSRFLPKYRNKIIAIPSGIYPDELMVSRSKEEIRKGLSLNINNKIILFVGNLINYKSPDLLVKAMPLILEKIPNAKLLFVGDGPLQKELACIAQDLNVNRAISFIGAVPHDSLATYYVAADVFALPSTGSNESFGIVILEAAAAGLPIVVSSLDTFRAFVKDGYNGILTQTGDVQSLAEALISVLSNTSLAQRISNNAKDEIKYYSWDSIAKKVESIYKTILEKRV